MIKSGILLTVIAVFIAFPPSTLHAQTRPGTVADSWKEAAGQPSQPAKPAAGSDAAAWNATRSPESRPWPSLPDKPMASDYYKANTMVIDSLARLYCVSSSYLHTLRQRNERASNQKGAAQEGKAFQYNPAPAAPKQGHESPQTLYRELNSLLDRCLHGR